MKKYRCSGGRAKHPTSQMTAQSIPVVDLRTLDSDRSAFVKRFGGALQDLGFVALEGHGIAQALFDEAYDVFRGFFAMPDEVKRRYEDAASGRRRGYTSFGVEHAKDNPTPDLKEFFHVGREGGKYPNLWPDDPPALRAVAMKLFDELDAVARELLGALAEWLGEAPTSLQSLAHRGNAVWRIIHYPVCDGFDRPGAMRAAQHEDINLMTLLPPADQSGLEILKRDGTWLAVHAVPGQIIVDTGDMMKRITADRIPATTHRVVNPEGAPEPRYSMPFFVHPHVDAVLSVLPTCVHPGAEPKYPPIAYEDFLSERLAQIGLAETRDA